MNTLQAGRPLARMGLAGATLLIALLLLAAAATLCFMSLHSGGSGFSGMSSGFSGGSSSGWGSEGQHGNGHQRLTIILAAAALVLLVFSLAALRAGLASMPAADDLPEPEKSSVLFGRHLVGIGFALLADALVNVVVVATLAWKLPGVLAAHAFTHGEAQPGPANLYGDAFDANETGTPLMTVVSTADAGDVLARLFGRTQAESFVVVVLLVMSTLVTLLGALFFFATSMWSKMQNAEREPFDRSIFWAGLWFRVGEAVVFNLVFFFLLRVYAPDQYLLLPLVALLVGMFLKSGEQLVSGLANRVFAAFAAMLPVDKPPVIAGKLYQCALGGIPGADPQRKDALASILDAVTSLRGVDRAVIDAQALVLRVRYDPDRTTVEDIKQTVQLLGYTVQPPP